MVSGAVWDDQNRNGIQDTGEPPLPGITVTLSRDSGALASVSAGRQVVTSSDGGYQFATVAAGAYRIEVAGPSGYLPTAPGSVTIIVPEDSDVTVPPIGYAWAPAHLYLPLVQR
jgi:serine-aspartate repeat-containing protein C/D/E